MQHWLLKTEPESFSYQDLVRLGRDRWNGVRNFSALGHMRKMKIGDRAFIYHTGKDKAIVGVADVLTEAYPDPAENDARFVVVDVAARYALAEPVGLKTIKSLPVFQDWLLTRQPRLSVMPVTPEHWQLIHQMGKTKLPG